MGAKLGIPDPAFQCGPIAADHGRATEKIAALEPVARRAFIVRIWVKALVMAVELAVAGVLHFQRGLGFELAAFFVVLPGAIVGWRDWSQLLHQQRDRLAHKPSD